MDWVMLVSAFPCHKQTQPFIYSNIKALWCVIREDQSLRIVKLITCTALYSVSKKREKNVAIMCCTKKH